MRCRDWRTDKQRLTIIGVLIGQCGQISDSVRRSGSCSSCGRELEWVAQYCARLHFVLVRDTISKIYVKRMQLNLGRGICARRSRPSTEPFPCWQIIHKEKTFAKECLAGIGDCVHVQEEASHAIFSINILYEDHCSILHPHQGSQHMTR